MEMKKIVVLLVIPVLMISTFGVFGCGSSDKDISFPDPNLELAIRGEIGKPTGKIERSDLEELTTIWADSRGIVDLTGFLNKPKTTTYEKKPQRNDPCSCGSNKKYKKCCGKFFSRKKRRQSP